MYRRGLIKKAGLIVIGPARRLSAPAGTVEVLVWFLRTPKDAPRGFHAALFSATDNAIRRFAEYFVDGIEIKRDYPFAMFCRVSTRIQSFPPIRNGLPQAS